MLIGIGIVGMPGSGKSLLTDAAKNLGIPTIVMGDLVREETKKRGLDLTTENVLSVAEDLRRKYGRKAVAILVIRKIKEENIMQKSDVVVIEGLRSPEEKDVFKDFFDRFVIVAVHASPRTRYKRMIERGRMDDTKSIEVMKKRDLKELAFGIAELLAMADFHLVNENKEKGEFYKECIGLLKTIIEEVKGSDKAS